MHDQRMVSRASFGFENRAHRSGVQGVSRQTVDRLRGQADQLSPSQGLRRLQHLIAQGIHHEAMPKMAAACKATPRACSAWAAVMVR